MRLSVERRGAWRAEDFAAVAGLLGLASNWIAPLGPLLDPKPCDRLATIGKMI
jgi:hypothetical protein